MPDINTVSVAGNLTRNPELRYIESGTALCTFGLAVSRNYKDKDGNPRDEVSFIDVTLWGKAAEYHGEHLKKGRSVLVVGRLKSESWEDKASGQKRTKLGIVADRVQQLTWEGHGNETPKPTQPTAQATDECYDDIPF